MPLLQPSPESSLSSKPETVDPDKLSFKERGFSFIPVRQAHLNYLVSVYGREHPSMDRVFGRTMVDKNFLPLGMALIYFPTDEQSKAECHAHFSGWFRRYPKEILDGMRPICRKARDAGVKELYAIADEAIEGSIDLVRWFDGEKTGERNLEPPVGDIYRLDLYSPKFKKWLDQRDRGYGYDVKR